MIKRTDLFSKCDIIVFACFFVLTLTLMLSVFPVKSESLVYDKVVRLHVLAASDSDEDQKIKLLVRDDVVKLTSKLFSDCHSQTQAREIAEDNSQLIVQTVKNTLLKNDRHDDVRVTMGVEGYPVRRYGTFTFPAGEYYSIRISIGKGMGHNWWCVLFPPLCAGSAVTSTDEGKAMLSANGLSDEEIASLVLSDGYSDYDGKDGTEVRFALIDCVRKVFGLKP